MQKIVILIAAAAASAQTVRYIDVDPGGVKTTEMSGRAGTAQTVREPGFNAFLYGLDFDEKADKPCYISARWWRYNDKDQPADFTTKFDICRDTAKGDKSIVFTQRADLRLAIDSVKVCTNDNKKDRLKGVELTAGSVDRNSSGGVEGAVQKDSFKRTNCDTWDKVRSCGSGNVAIGLVIDHTDEEITGLGLKCAEPVVRTDSAISSSAQERYAKMESDIRVTVDKDGRSEIMTIAQAVDRHEVGGATVVVIENGEISVVRHYGLRNKKKNLPTNKDTVYPTASISKLVGAIAMLTAARSGQGPTLDTTLVDAVKTHSGSIVDRWVEKQFKGNEQGYPAKITLRRLLSHTAGLDTHGIGTAKDDGPTKMDNILLGAFGNPGVKPISSPGSDWQYSGGGYTAAEGLLEAWSGQTSKSFLTSQVLLPLGMKRSTYAEAHDSMDALARGCSRGLCSDNPEHTMVKFAGGLIAHPEDYARLLTILVKDGKDSSGVQLIPSSDIQDLFTPAARSDSSLTSCNSATACPASERCYKNQCIRPLNAAEKDLRDDSVGEMKNADWYGLGVWLSKDDDYKGLPRFVYHGGANETEGVRTHFKIDRKNQKGVLIMINGEYDWKKNSVSFGADALKADILAAFERAYL